MQSLADGTDAVLNGLADGTDIVLNGLSEGADQALGGLSEADDGQAKDSIVNAFGELVGDAGNAALTPQSKLQGAVLRWSEKQEVQSTSPVHFLSKAAKQQFFFAQGQMIRLFFSRRAVSTMAQ